MSTSSEQVFFALKRILKAKKVTYRDLGTRLHVSEAAVKKMFMAKDCSMSRLDEICSVIGVSIGDLFEATRRLPLKTVELTEKQSHFLSAHPHYYNFFQKLAFERQTVSEIARGHRLNERSVRKYLRKLDELGLVEVHAKDRIKSNLSGFVKVKIKGAALKRLRADGVCDFIEKIDSETEQQTLGRIHFKFDPATAKRFRAELHELIERYFLQSEIEQNLNDKPSLEVLNLVVAFAPHSWIGEIINLV